MATVTISPHDAVLSETYSPDAAWAKFVWSEHTAKHGTGCFRVGRDKLIVGWQPIRLVGKHVIDGGLRVTCARLLGIEAIEVEQLL